MSSATATKRNKRSNVIRLSLAALALAGIGAAATTAAWTDNVFFAANASSATFELQGSVNGGATKKASDSTLAVEIPATTFAQLIPGATRTVTVNVTNTGSVDALLKPAALTTKDGVFGGTNPAKATVTAITSGTKLAPGATLPLTVTVVAPESWDNTYQNLPGGTITIIVNGASS